MPIQNKYHEGKVNSTWKERGHESAWHAQALIQPLSAPGRRPPGVYAQPAAAGEQHRVTGQCPGHMLAAANPLAPEGATGENTGPPETYTASGG